MADRYDVFVSFKNLDSQGQPTRDSELARLVFEHLTSKGLSVFFSNVALERAGEAAFKKAIDDALDRSETLVAVGTSKQNLESRWVRYEWDSFYTDILSGVNPDSRMFTYVEGLDIRSLPRTLRQSQMIEHGEDSLGRLYRFIANGLRDGNKPSNDAAVEKFPWTNSFSGTAGKTFPKVSKTDAAGIWGTPGPGGELKSVLSRRPSPADIEGDPSLSREDKNQIKLMWEVAELDEQCAKILERIIALDRERGPSAATKREAVSQQLELLTQQRNAKMDEVKKILEKQSLKDIFK